MIEHTLQEAGKFAYYKPRKAQNLLNSIDLNKPLANGQTPIQWALANSNCALVDKLLEMGADFELPAYLPGSALKSSLPYPDIFQRLIVDVDNLDYTDEDGRTLLIRAATLGAKEACKILLNKGKFIDTQDKDGDTALHQAIKNNNLQTVELLVKNGADPSLTNYTGVSPLWLAVIEHYNITIGMLLQAGGGRKPDQTDYIPKLAIKAIREGHNDIAKMMIQTAVGLDYKDDYQRSLMSWACIQNNSNLIFLIAKTHPSLSTDKVSSKYSVMWSILHDELDLLELLISHGARTDIPDQAGNKPIDWAKRQGKDRVKELLRD